MSEARKIRVNTTEEEESGNAPNGSGEEAPAAAANGNGESSREGQPSLEPRLEDVQAQLEAKETQYQETYDRLLRLTAEFENYKKRMSREMEDFRKYANQSLLKEMLSAVDHIELAIRAASAPSGADAGMVDGLNLTLKEFLRILEKFNVRPIEAVGKPFDPQLHEAIMQETCDLLPENTVVREMQKGYTICDRLLRPEPTSDAC
jgi:molecular chaperone GrpE